METNEKILLNYAHNITYNNTVENQVGTDADQTTIFGSGNLQRTVPTPTGDTAYVRKFGLAHTITDLTDLSNPGVANLTWTVKTVLGTTTYGSRANGGAYTDGATTGTATAIRLEASVSGATTVLPTTMGVTDAAVGALTINLPAESVTSVSPRIFYLARSGSSYYDTNLKYGGARHTPVLTSSAFPYFDIATAYGALAAANNDAVEILDSESYDEDLTTDNQALDSSDTIVYAKSDKSPTITNGKGARITREVSTQYNNTNAIYFNENGNDANDGTWQFPKLTIAGAIAARAAEDIIYGGDGATIYNGIFVVAVTIAAAYVFEPDYGYRPRIFNIIGNAITVSAAAATIRGWYIDTATQYGIYSTNINSLNIYDCTVYNATLDGVYTTRVGAAMNINLERCIIDTIGQFGIFNSRVNAGAGTSTTNIKNNIVKGCGSWGMNIYRFGTGGQDGDISMNQIYNCVGRGLHIDGAYTGTISNNTIYNITSSGSGIYIAAATVTVENTIIHTVGYAVYLASGGITLNYCNFYNYTTAKFSGAPTNNNEVSGDPKLCSTIIPYKLGLSGDSVAYRASAAGDDIGTIMRIIEIDADDIVINGINIDGQSTYNSGVFIRDTADHTGLNIKWCNIYNFQGIAIDLYDNDAALNAIIANNIIKDNGNGLKLTYNGNTVDENIIQANTIYGIYNERDSNVYNHNVFYNNQYGLYLDNLSSAITVKNCIFNQNTLYGIYAELSVIITYCCITDAINATVDNTDSTNITNNPLFVNTTLGSENFNIKTLEWNNGEFQYDSACKDAGDDSEDIGAYNITRDTDNDYWDKYQFTYNPRIIQYKIDGKGNTRFNSGTGTQWSWGKGRRRGFSLQWQTGQYSDETDRLKVEFFNSLYQQADKTRSDEAIKVRLNLLPSQQIDSGTNATVNATAKTVTDSTQSLVEDQYKGYHIGLQKEGISGATPLTTIFYAGFEVDLFEWSAAWQNGAGTILRTVPGLIGTVGKGTITLPGAEINKMYFFVLEHLSTFGIVANTMRFELYLDITGLIGNMGNTDSCGVFELKDTGGNLVCYIILEYTIANGYRFRCRYYNDAAVGTWGDYITAVQGVNHIEVSLTIATNATSSDGIFRSIINDVFYDNIITIDNYDIYQIIDEFFCGITDTDGIEATTSGTLSYDEVYIYGDDGMEIDATNKKAIVRGAKWTDDEWIGWYLPHNGYYYYITDNNSWSLTLADPNSTLIDTYLINWHIEKYFKILENTATIFTVEDDNAEITTGTYDWIIRFIECHVLSPNMTYSQPRYYYQKETWKTGHKMYLEEI